MTWLVPSGATFERRSFLRLPALAALGGLQAEERDGALDFAAFTAECERLARAHLDGGRPFPEALLLELAAAGARLRVDGVPRPELKAFGGYEPAVRFAPVHRAPPVLLIEWALEPHAVLPPHNHTPAYVLSFCLGGEVRLRHFEIEGDAPAPGEPGEFTLRETRAQRLRPGHATSLTPERDNVHTFHAGADGAWGVDVNVFLPGDGDWSMIELASPDGADPSAARRARWIGKPKS